MHKIPFKAILVLFLFFIFQPNNLLAVDSDLYLNDKIEVGRSYYRAGSFEKAYEILKGLFNDHPQNLTINFLLGRTAFELKKYEEAVFTYERLLIAHPDLVRVKLEMARTYMILGTNEEAKRLYNEVLETNPPDDVKNNIKKMLRLVSAGERKHILASSIQLGRGFDDNVNTSPTDEIIEIPAFGNLPMSVSDKKSQAFTTAALDFAHIYNFQSQFLNRAKTSISYFRNDYDSVEEQNLDFFNFDFTPVMNIGSSSFLSTGITGQHIRVDNEAYMNIYGIHAGLSHNLTNSHSFNLNMSHFIKAYEDYSMRDGSNTGLNFSWTSKAGKFYITPSLGLSMETADSDIYSYLRFSGGLGVAYIPVNSLMFSASYRYQHSEYDEDEPLFKEKRKDDSGFFSADAKWMFWRNKKGSVSTAIGLSHLFIDNSSNIEVYDYDKNKTTLYLKLSF